MTKISSADLNRLAKNPVAMQKYLATGHIDAPRNQNKTTPLYRLLSQINMGDLSRFRNIILGPSLGYRLNSRNPFVDGTHLRRWLENPSGPGPGSHLQGFSKELTLNDLCDASKISPELDALRRHYSRLMLPRASAPETDGPT